MSGVEARTCVIQCRLYRAIILAEVRHRIHLLEAIVQLGNSSVAYKCVPKPQWNQISIGKA